jgi:phage terminase large subunit-like protein
MAEPSDIEARVAALEARIEEVAADATAARHLAAARDRDLADLGVKVDANRSVINAFGEQTAARFTRVEERIDTVRSEMRSGFAEVHNRFAEVDNGFADMRGKLDQAAAGQQQIVELLNTLIGREGDH